MNPQGLHARLAVELVKICRDAESHVDVMKDGVKVNGREAFSVMNLYARSGDRLEFAVRGMDEDDILLQIIRFCRENL